MKSLMMTVVFAVAVSNPTAAADIQGPGRFCGYSPIIDLLAGESVTTLEGGIHAGSFRWNGAFGSLEVSGIGWASRPRGRIIDGGADGAPARFAQRRTEGKYVIAIWNGEQGAAYFHSDRPFNEGQIAAIRRVRLFQEGESPSGCSLRTVFSWED